MPEPINRANVEDLLKSGRLLVKMGQDWVPAAHNPAHRAGHVDRWSLHFIAAGSGYGVIDDGMFDASGAMRDGVGLRTTDGSDG